MSHLINHACNQCGPGRIWSCGTCGCHNFDYNHLCRNCGTAPPFPVHLLPSFPQHVQNWTQPGLAQPFVEEFVRHPAQAPVPAPAPVSGIWEAQRRHGERRKNRRHRRKQREEKSLRIKRKAERMRSGEYTKEIKTEEGASTKELLFRTGNARPADIAKTAQVQAILQRRLAQADAAVEVGKKRLEEAQTLAAMLIRRLGSSFIPKDVVVAILEEERDLI